MDLSRTVTEINGEFSQKSQHFPTPLYIAPLLKGFPSKLGIGAGSQKLEWWATRLNKMFDDIFSSLDTIHQCDRQTDRLTDGWKDGHRATAKTVLSRRLRIMQ